jgi:hypothetical protein
MGIIARRWARQARRGLLRELGVAIALGEDPDLAAMSAPAVSGWSVHQHLEHLWRADAEIVGWLARVREGAVASDGPGSTIAGAVVLWLGMIPRGKGRAPQFTRPAGSQLQEIVAGFQAVRQDVEILGGALDRLAAATTTRRHPLLGCYTAAQWLRFIHVHHVHHRRIIEEVCAAFAGGKSV